MAIYVDPLRKYDSGEWCHMASDGTIQALHAMATKIGLKREWFQDHPRVSHYDLRSSKRVLAIENGAIEVSSIELVKKCKVEKLS